jgi:hypothetical protein
VIRAPGGWPQYVRPGNRPSIGSIAR